MKSKLFAVVAAMFVSSLFAASAQAVVLRVVVVQTENPDAYVKELDKGQALMKKLGSSAQLRVWRARFAGNEAGTVVVSIEYSDLATFAEDDKKTSASAEFQAWLKGLAKIRKIVSDSLYDELKSAAM